MNAKELAEYEALQEEDARRQEEAARHPLLKQIAEMSDEDKAELRKLLGA